MLTRTSEIIGDYLEDRNKREERAAQLQEVKMLLELEDKLPVYRRKSARERADALLQKLGITAQ